MHNNLFEGLEKDDLARLIHPELHVDEFKSKLGDDQDVVVLSFKVDAKEPANDLVAFVEKGYDWVVDAEYCTGRVCRHCGAQRLRQKHFVAFDCGPRASQ